MTLSYPSFFVTALLVGTTTAGYGIHSQQIHKAGRKFDIQSKVFSYQDSAELKHRTTRIAGGRNANPREIPYMLSLHHNGTFQCGASYVKDTTGRFRFALTAAHCIRKKKGLTVVAGSPSFDRYGFTKQIMKVRKVVIHPKYGVTTGGLPVNDIALLFLDDKFRENWSVQPISLPIVSTWHYTSLFTAGWGQVPDQVYRPEMLQVVEVPVVQNIECDQMYKLEYNSISMIISPSQICAGEIHGEKDTCKGDSGGPLATKWDWDTKWAELVGVTSFGFGCGNSHLPGVYSRVSDYLWWINKKVRQFAVPK